MATPTEAWQPLLDGLERLREAWPGTGWTWDPVPMRVVVVRQEDRRAGPRGDRRALGARDGRRTATNLASTRPAVQALAERYGGVRAGQMLFTGAASGGMRLFALWWPWGDGATISLRVSIENGERDAELFPKMRALFGLA